MKARIFPQVYSLIGFLNPILQVLVGKSWLSFINNEKSTWIRVIKTMTEDQGIVNWGFSEIHGKEGIHEYIKEDPKEGK